MFTWLAQLNGLAQRVLAVLVMLTAGQLDLLAQAPLTQQGGESERLQRGTSEPEASMRAIRMRAA